MNRAIKIFPDYGLVGQHSTQIPPAPVWWPRGRPIGRADPDMRIGTLGPLVGHAALIYADDKPDGCHPEVPVRLTDLLTRPCGTGETQRRARDGRRTCVLVSETGGYAGDMEGARRMAHYPAMAKDPSGRLSPAGSDEPHATPAPSAQAFSHPGGSGASRGANVIRPSRTAPDRARGSTQVKGSLSDSRRLSRTYLGYFGTKRPCLRAVPVLLDGAPSLKLTLVLDLDVGLAVCLPWLCWRRGTRPLCRVPMGWESGLVPRSQWVRPYQGRQAARPRPPEAHKAHT